MSRLIEQVLLELKRLDVRRGERGMVHGRRESTPADRRAPINLDVLSLTDPRSSDGAPALLRRWANRVRTERPAEGHDARVLVDHWDWALTQPWGPQMSVELSDLLGRMTNDGRAVKVAVCPVCRRPSRVDRFVAEHRLCLSSEIV